MRTEGKRVPGPGDSSLPLSLRKAPCTALLPRRCTAGSVREEMGAKLVPESSAGGSGALHHGLWAPFPLRLLGDFC